jgi:hypothetical protein
MADDGNAETNERSIKAKPVAQPGGSKPSFLDTYAPVPDFFYDVKRVRTDRLLDRLLVHARAPFGHCALHVDHLRVARVFCIL